MTEKVGVLEDKSRMYRKEIFRLRKEIPWYPIATAPRFLPIMGLEASGYVFTIKVEGPIFVWKGIWVLDDRDDFVFTHWKPLPTVLQNKVKPGRLPSPRERIQALVDAVDDYHSDLVKPILDQICWFRDNGFPAKGKEE